MKKGFSSLSLFLSLLFLTFSAQAHHPAHNAGQGGASPFNTLALNASSTFRFLGLGYEQSFLDNDLGYLSQLSLNGEYSFGKHLALGGRIPLLMVRDRALPYANELGDISLTGRYLFFPTDQLTLSTFLEISLPVGDENKGTGNGSVVVSPGLVMNYEFNQFSIFTSMGISTKLTEDDQVVFNPLLGLKVPLAKQGLTVAALASIESSIYLTSSAFDSGSSKVYVRPALQFGFGPQWWVTASGKISVADTLQVKSGKLAPSSTTLLGDVEASWSLDVSKIF